MKYLLLVSLFMLYGCSPKPFAIGYKCPEIILPADPYLPIKGLNENSGPDEVIKSYVATVLAYQNWNKTVRKQIQHSN